jgi:8-oxo-dGTP diphosphatase
MAIDWEIWEPNMRATLVFVICDGQILLIRKKRGLGAGKVNGPGGKIDPGETPVQCAVREAQEELGITALEPEEIGVLHFNFVDGLAIQCHVFRATGYEGTAVETDEAIPLWTALDAIPLDEMWADDRLWIPHLVNRQQFRGYFEFDGEQMLRHRMDLLD